MLRISALMFIAFAVFDTGCGGGNSIDGTWVYTENTDGLTVSAVMTFGSDGTLDETATVSSCKGTLTTTGITWTSTATTISATGTPSCTGSLTCTVDGFTSSSNCGASTSMSGITGSTCNYTLSNDDNTLTLSGCTGGKMTGSMVLTRQSP
jgi:hypothetical protein